MLLIEVIILCVLFFFLCYCNTGSDKKNMKSLSSYPNEIQDIVREDTTLKEKTKATTPIISFISNIIVFTVILFVFALVIKKENFTGNFINVLILGQSLNLFDFLIIDMVWWRNTNRVRFTGTKHLDKVYKNPKKHFFSFVKGILAFLIVAVIDGLLLSLF
jgi:hypothetical protein